MHACMTSTASLVPVSRRNALLLLITAGGAQITMDWEMGSAVTDFRLVDVPELGYHTTDRPFPRGELQLKTQSMIQGYHKQAKACCHLADPVCSNPEAFHDCGTGVLQVVPHKPLHMYAGVLWFAGFGSHIVVC